MTFQVDVILEYISLFFEITWYLEMYRWFLLKMSFIVTFLPQYCLFNGSLLSYASWQTFLMFYFFSSIVGIVKGPFFFRVLRFQSQIPHMFLAWLFEPMKGVIHYGR